ncbi:hypothetical protein SLEP1_g5525 [Rubroshorea leprosula]|uniref:Uncharacterized protein n=1 Tax=Rubroshorea leprosula TaxID=152421 RepID=A0AAV5HYI6_9ROSI|nr:hypothetical protein SLEP1_g5525 [Rubroshorea leprosula]
MAAKEGFILLAIFALLVMTCTNSCESLSWCSRKCMLVCLKEEGANIDACVLACTSYCKHVAEYREEKRKDVWDWTNSRRH